MRRLTASPQDPDVQLAIADFTERSLHRQLRAARRLTFVLGVALTLALVWGALG